jgi:sporulation protein YlmC with PRC-barrel domain
LEIPLDVQVECTDGVYGVSVFVLINPVAQQITHLIVAKDLSLQKEYMVPIDFVSVTKAGTILLRCSKVELENMDPFISTRFFKEEAPYYSWNREYGKGKGYYWPYVVSPKRSEGPSVQDLQIPVKEMAVGRGTRVEASDGYVGKVDEFVVNPDTGHISHLVMREGHLWGKKDVIIPISAMGDTRQDTVFLKLDKAQIEALPTFPLQRRWS